MPRWNSGRQDVSTQTYSSTNNSNLYQNASRVVFLNRVCTRLENDDVEINAAVSGIQLRVFLDSGADVSCLSAESWKRLNTTEVLETSTVDHGITANGTRLKFEGRVKLPFTTGGVTVMHSFYVCSGLTHFDCLLGKDFMRNHKGIIDFSTEEFTFDETKCRPSANCVSVADRCVLPKLSEADVVCRIPKSS